MKYRAKPVETDAIQFDGENWAAVNEFAGTHWIDIDVYMDNFIPVEEMWVDIPEGIVGVVWVEPSKQWAGVKVGDYIVRDLEGDVYPCEKSIFERKYKPVENKMEVSLQGGVVTAEQINRAIGHSIQQSRRFQG
ncbi:hypothetical protein SEA_BEUFFERT_67 [Streptomyces phage Beuffert]|nr:hypothetical protein SEA_BEUFFERT_67 [Streptomyces phage Beuffert]